MNRRSLLKNSAAAFSGVLLTSKVLQAKTPAQPEGPFYPVVDQIDKDADLIRVDGKSQIAAGKIVIVSGRVIDQNNQPVTNARVEIWQACDSGKYDHPADPNTAPLDPNFQYWGIAQTNNLGEYKFRTIIPGTYPAGSGWVRPPHIHFKISALGYIELITQMYFAGETLNDNDLIFKRLSKSDQNKVVVNFIAQENEKHPIGIFNIEIEKI